MPSEISRSVEYQNLEYESILQVSRNFGFLNIKPFSKKRGKPASRIQTDSSSTVEFRVLEYYAILVLPWKIGF